MTAVRRLLARPVLAALLCAATLLVRLAVPAGYMVGSDRGRPTIELCAGVAGQSVMPGMAGMPGMAAPDHHHRSDHGKAEMPCAFAGLAAAALAAWEPAPLAAPIAFGEAAGRVALVPQALVASAYLRPPLRGPPLFG